MYVCMYDNILMQSGVSDNILMQPVDDLMKVDFDREGELGTKRFLHHPTTQCMRIPGLPKDVTWSQVLQKVPNYYSNLFAKIRIISQFGQEVYKHLSNVCYYY